MAAMMNMTNLLNGKDSRWLQLEVCREFQRNKCSRPDTECKFAHPPANVEVQNGRVTACYDSIKGRCNREKPPCKYFHPPQHLKDQLLINGRNHLALKNAIMQQMGISPGQPVLPGQVPAVTQATNPYLASMPASTYSPYFQPGHLMPTLLGPADPSQLGPVVQQAVVPQAQQKIPRSDRLEAFPGMVPYKRTAADKSGIPVYQPGATTYQQLMQLQQPFVPVSCEYPTPSSSATSATYIPQTSSTATLIANNSSSNSAPSTILTSSSYYTSSGNSVNNNNNNNNNSKVNNKNTTLAKSLSLQSIASVGGHLSNGQGHSDTDQSAQSEGHLSEKDDLSVVSAAASVSGSDALLTLTPTSTPASQAMVSTSATQSVQAPITSAMLNYSVSAAQINSYNASIQAQAQAMHAAQAAAVAQANQAAAASAQYSAHYADAANLAKEVAQKNYANALKMAAASNALTGKPLTALSYTGVALNKTSLMTPAQSYSVSSATAATAPAYPPPRIGTPAMAVAAATPQQTMLPTLSRPPPPILPQAAFTQMLRPQMPANLMHNPYAAAAAVAQQQQQLMSQAGFMYPAFQAAGGYQFGSPMHTAIPGATNLTAMPGAMTQMPQVTATPTPGSAVVLNPYKKMKTS